MSPLVAGMAGILSGVIAGQVLCLGSRQLARLRGDAATLSLLMREFRSTSIDDERQELLFRFGMTLLPASVLCLVYSLGLFGAFVLVPYICALRGQSLLSYSGAFTFVSILTFVSITLHRKRQRDREEGAGGD